MEIRFLGAHNIESASTGFPGYLIDGILAVDAGTLTSRLSFDEQKNIKAILLTHPHYDHMRDIPSIGMNCYLMKTTIDIYAPAPVQEALLTHLINGKLYPDFSKFPEEKPVFRFHSVEAGKKETIERYEVLPVMVKHAVPAIGYQISSPEGRKVFITSDTGPELADTWQQVSPDVLITELTMTNSQAETANKAGHMTPSLLKKELESFKRINNYLPKVVLMHTNPFIFNELKPEVNAVEKALKIKITFSREGMKIKV
jgi:ribonuclease BN (tRNA processing enzyme)